MEQSVVVAEVIMQFLDVRQPVSGSSDCLSFLIGLLEHRGQPAIGGDDPMLEVPLAVAFDEFIVLAALLDDLRQ